VAIFLRKATFHGDEEYMRIGELENSSIRKQFEVDACPVLRSLISDP
jgi:hypothetical protein